MINLHKTPEGTLLSIQINSDGTVTMTREIYAAMMACVQCLDRHPDTSSNEWPSTRRSRMAEFYKALLGPEVPSE